MKKNRNQFLNYAYEVLKTAERPLTYQEIWDEGVKVESNRGQTIYNR